MIYIGSVNIIENEQNNLSKDYKLIFILAILFIPAEKIKAMIDYRPERNL